MSLESPAWWQHKLQDVHATVRLHEPCDAGEDVVDRLVR